MKKLFIIILLLVCFNSKGQQIIIDLSNDKLDNIKITSGTKEILMLNTLQNKKYSIKVNIVDKLPIPIPPIVNAPAGDNESILGDATKCEGGSEILDEINVVNDVASEKDLKLNYDKLMSKINALSSDCKTEALKLLAEKDAKRKIKTFIENLKPNQDIKLTIERRETEGGTLEKVWELDMETETKMEKWVVHYGFTYQPNLIQKYDKYFSKQLGVDSFRITRKGGNQLRAWDNLSPTVMISHPLSKEYKDFMWGVSFIASTNFSNYSAGIGFSGIIAYNGYFGLGVMATQKHVLNGQYEKDEIIKQSLSFDQLHEKRWGPEVFFTIGIRFDKNPFSGKSKESETGENEGTPTDNKPKDTETPKEE